MKQKFFIVLGLIILIVILIGLNAVSYTQKEKELDSEAYPNRSTYNYGSTGTRAFFDLLAETGHRPVRWQESPAGLLIDNENKPSTFVIVGRLRKQITDEEARHILRWVSEGGKLVVIDRAPPVNLVQTSANWKLSFNTSYLQPTMSTDASDQKEMTKGIRAAKPVQPTVYTQSVNGVQTSAFATSIDFAPLTDEEIESKANRSPFDPAPVPTFSKTPTPRYQTPPPVNANANTAGSGSAGGRAQNSNVSPEEEKINKIINGNTKIDRVVVKATPMPKDVLKAPPVANSEGFGNGSLDYELPELTAPVVHLVADGRNIMVDVPHGLGRIVFLSDPYTVANGGINLVDNAQLALNAVGAPEGGIIAFDEYHHGYGSSSNRLLEFFAGTPVIPIFLQIALLIFLIFLSQSRRFARAVPEPEPSRLSKLEYVSAMAELQQRTKGFDLAIENIYTDFRRRVSRLVGVDAQKTRRQDLALLIVERLPQENPDELEQLMKRCEDVMHGDATNKKEVLRLTTRLRELEEKLGLQRRKRQRKAV